MVDSVQNNGTNNTALYTALGAGVGAVGGGAYGKFMTTPHMKGDDLSDTFVKTVNEVQIADTKSANKTLVEELGKIKENGKLEGISDTVKKELQGSISAEDFGKKTEAELKSMAEGLLDTKIKAEGAKDAAELITKLDAKAEANAVDKLLTKKQVVDAIAEDADAAALKKAITDNAEKLGIKAEGGKTLEQAVDDFIGGKDAKTIKKEITDQFDTIKNPIKELFDGKKLKAEADVADKNLFNAAKKAIGKLTNKAALKWGAIAAGVLALIGLGAGIATKKAPEAPAEEQHVSTQA